MGEQAPLDFLLARVAWADLRSTLGWLEEEKDHIRFRILLFAAVSLVRAIGHVLLKSDGENPALNPCIKSLYATWKTDRDEHEIFWEFIESERNRLLKEYVWSFDQTPEVTLIKDGQVVESCQFDENIYCPVASGPFQGDDIRDVLGQALNWWDAQLKLVESDARKFYSANKRE